LSINLTISKPQQAEVKHSSGFERLDQTALNTVLKWRYLPGKRNGTPEAMWLQVPLEFILE
jgi:protein TonB